MNNEVDQQPHLPSSTPERGPMTSEGYGFAAFRSHSMVRPSNGWTVPGVDIDALSESAPWVACECGENFMVIRHAYCYHDYRGKCHNATRCV